MELLVTYHVFIYRQSHDLDIDMTGFTDYITDFNTSFMDLDYYL